jgi:YgiT-type zinc finger domain-containing protein
MKCEFCNGERVQRKVRKQHWFNGRLYVIENVTAEVCRECGERYFHATTLDKLDAMISGDHKIKEMLSVEVITAQTVARREDDRFPDSIPWEE